MIRRRSGPPRWQNWARNQTAVPESFLAPPDEATIARIVTSAAERGARVKAVGSGHSFTDIACTDQVLLDLAAVSGVIEADTGSGRVRVRAGTRLADLNAALAELGLALPNLGDIDRQTLAGATQTGTHGTGSGFRCISAAIVGARLVDGSGRVVEVSETDRPDLLGPVRVGLGALGVLTELTFQCVPAFNLRAVEEIVDVDEVVESFDEVADAADHAEFFWFPGTRLAQRKANTRTDDPPARRGRVQQFVADEVVGNVALGLSTRLGRRRPEVVPALFGRALTPGQRVVHTAPSHEVFCSPRRVRFKEMEYAVPRSDLLEVFGRVRRLVDSLPAPVGFPIEVRVLGADDIPLSMASGRDSGFLAVHVEAGVDHEAYFAGVEAIMVEHGGRPHWGKLHRRSAADLSPLYPGWDEFQAARRELDPDGRFANVHLDRILGDG